MTTTENALVAHSVPASGLGGATAGSGLFSDAASTLTDAQNGDWVNLGLDAATDGLDLLGAAMDPLGTLASAGVGWLIEHISFLHKGLDELAGNPEEVTAGAQTWTNIAEALTEAGTGYADSATRVAPAFVGDGGQAYQNTAKSYVDLLHGAAGHARGAATAMQIAAALVGTERGLIRDLISSFVGELILKAVAALASSWCSFGASVAAFIADTVLEASALAERIGSRIAKVVDKLTQLAQKAGKSKGAIEAATKALGKVGKGAERLADKGLNAATRLDSKAGELRTAAAHAKPHTVEDLKAAARRPVDRGLDHLDAARERIAPEGTRIHSSRERIDSAGGRVAEPGRSTLNPERWEDAAHKARHDGWEFRPPGWNSADTTGVLTEGRRQENEQLDRAGETREEYERERERGGESERGESERGGENRSGSESEGGAGR